MEIKFLESEDMSLILHISHLEICAYLLFSNRPCLLKSRVKKTKLTVKFAEESVLIRFHILFRRFLCGFYDGSLLNSHCLSERTVLSM